MKIDSHQHFWHYRPQRDTWIENHMGKIRRDFLPSDLAPRLKENDFDGCIAVQADQSEEETDFLLALAEEHPFIKGVIGWIDLCSPTVEKRLQHYVRRPKFCGIRHIVQAEPDGFLERAAFRRGIALLAAYHVPYDLLIYPHQLPAAITFAKTFPSLQIMLNHLAKPPVATGKITQWKADIHRLATLPNVACKISGLVTEAHWDNWQESDFQPYLTVVFDAFGTDRIVYGSDWPVCLLAARYNEQLSLITNFITRYPKKVQAQIMGLNAEKFYTLTR